MDKIDGSMCAHAGARALCTTRLRAKRIQKQHGGYAAIRGENAARSLPNKVNK